MPQVGMQLAAFVLLFPCGVPICPLGSKTEMDSSSRLAPPGDNHFLIFTISHKHIVMLYITLKNYICVTLMLGFSLFLWYRLVMRASVGAGSTPAEAEHGVLWCCWHCRPSLSPRHHHQVSSRSATLHHLCYLSSISMANCTLPEDSVNLNEFVPFFS